MSSFIFRILKYIKTLLPLVDISPDRLEMYNLSASMGPRWKEICTEFTERIRQIGPSPLWWADRESDLKE
jgi:F420-non-reducing hydrogenase iron-sulfur subunit